MVIPPYSPVHVGQAGSVRSAAPSGVTANQAIGPSRPLAPSPATPPSGRAADSAAVHIPAALKAAQKALAARHVAEMAATGSRLAGTSAPGSVAPSEAPSRALPRGSLVNLVV